MQIRTATLNNLLIIKRPLTVAKFARAADIHEDAARNTLARYVSQGLLTKTVGVSAHAYKGSSRTVATAHFSLTPKACAILIERAAHVRINRRPRSVFELATVAR